MSEHSFQSRIGELAKRAGMGEVPPAVLTAAAAVCVVAVLWAAWRWLPAALAAQRGAAAPTGTVQAQASSSDQQPPSEAPAESTEPSAPAIVVHVAGKVRHPGVYSLTGGSRVIDAVEAAGGFLGDAAQGALNLARVVADGEQIVVPSESEAADGVSAPGAGNATSASGSGGAGAQASAPVNINTADAAALETLPGVGPATSAKIIADREANGPFGTPDDLGRVSGIGPKRLEQLKALISVR